MSIKMKNVICYIPICEGIEVRIKEEVEDDFPVPDGSEIIMMGNSTAGYSTLATDLDGDDYFLGPWGGKI